MRERHPLALRRQPLRDNAVLIAVTRIGRVAEELRAAPRAPAQHVVEALAIGLGAVALELVDDRVHAAPHPVVQLLIRNP